MSQEQNPGEPPTRRRNRRLRQVGAAVLAALLVTLGIVLYFDERDTRQAPTQVGAPTGKDWIELDVIAQRVDPSAGLMTLSVVPIPHGALAQGPDSLVFARAIEVDTTSLTKSSFKVAAGALTVQQQVPVGIYDGTLTDYPFDRYAVAVGFAATAGDGASLPVAMVFQDADPFFVVRPKQGAASPGPDEVLLEAKVSRSRSTFILAWFMMAAMWALALAVAGGAQVLLRKRPGIVWPALGWMAATLFALVGLRNAAPGSPPIGSIIDYLAFFWAEGVIAVSLVVTAATGVRTELRPAAPPAP